MLGTGISPAEGSSRLIWNERILTFTDIAVMQERFGIHPSLVCAPSWFARPAISTRIAPFVRELVANMAIYSTGDGIRVEAQSAKPDWNRAAESYFAIWSARCEGVACLIRPYLFVPPALTPPPGRESAPTSR